jgi:predicted small secreted protein
MKLKKKIIALLFTLSFGLASLFAFTGCEASEGLGRDLQDLGEEVEDAAS